MSVLKSSKNIFKYIIKWEITNPTLPKIAVLIVFEKFYQLTKEDEFQVYDKNIIYIQHNS